jgi:acyl-CoA synthetase (AMP-forming)/AMP-acid ligase II
LVELIPSRDSEAGLFGLTDENTIKPVASIEARQEDEALVLHTSGTTSRPKMVPLTQANLCASARHISQTLSLTPQDRCLNVMPLFHIHGLVGVLLSSVFAGASVTCTPGFDVGRFFEWFQVFQPTWYSAVPTMHQAILGQLAGLQNRPGFTGLRFIRSSSASLPPSVMAELEACFGVPVIESYGMTEAAHQMASNPLPPRPRKPGSVGVAAGPEIAVMNERGDLLPGGERGQIVIRGANVMQGYANNPQANQDAFKGGWFLTGDEGYLDEDGYLFITGRLKEMINRGGEKVTPREVDEVFLEHPAVAQAVTFAVAHPTLGEDIAIAVVLKESKQATEKELRSYAMERLAGYKVPSQVLILDHLPKGPTGKIQRIGLHEKLAPMLQAAHQAPTTPLEEALTRLWREVLNINDVSVRDNFFYLGGDSLLGALLNARIQAAFQLKLPSNSIFHSPTILDQAELIQELLLQEIEAMSEEEAIRLSESGR